jgi:hypothetical protein
VMKTALRAICAAGTVLLLMAPAASAEIQRSHEVITVGFPTKDDFYVYAVLHPQERVAVLGAQTNVKDLSPGVWSSTSYVERVPGNSIGDTIHVDFGSLGQIDGRFVADVPPHVGHLSRYCHGRRPTSQNGYFAGKFIFRGDGGYLEASRNRAQIAVVRRSFRLRCKKGHAAQFRNPRPSLFGYVQAPTDYLSNEDGTYLRSVSQAENLATEFLALDHLYFDTVGFKAVAREWLPGEVATTRSVEVERAPEAALTLGEPEQRPETASVHPPLPFGGAAEYIRSLGHLEGDLAVSFLGKELPLAAPGSEAKICARPNQDKLWNCE